VEREPVLHECDVARRVDAAGGDVVAAIATMVHRVSDEDARHGSMAELVCCCRRHVGVAEAAEGSQRVVAWRGTEEQVVRCDRASGTALTAINEERRRVERLNPEVQRSCTVK
jgi:hypothetical protein